MPHSTGISFSDALVPLSPICGFQFLHLKTRFRLPAESLPTTRCRVRQPLFGSVVELRGESFVSVPPRGCGLPEGGTVSSSLFSCTLTPASSRLLRPSTPVTAPRVSPPCWPLRPIRRPPIKAEAVPASHTRHRPVSLPLKPSLFLNVQNGSPATSPLNVLWLSARVIRASPAPTLPGRCFGRGSSGSCSAGPLLSCRPPLTLPCRGALPAPRRSPAAAVPGAPFSASLPA